MIAKEAGFLKIAIQAALAAGREIAKVYEQKSIDVEYKEDNSPLTLADRNSHDAIISLLGNSPFPILSEEGKNMPYGERKDWNRYWLIDPLDGTKEFIRRNGEFTVNIALVEAGVPVLGVVYIPVSDIIYFAEAGSGAYKQCNSSLRSPAKPIRISASYPTGSEIVIVASRSHNNEQTEKYIDKIREQYNSVKISNSGSSLKLCKIADGSAHIYPRFGPTMEWDTAAAHAVCREAGAMVYDISTGSEMVYNKNNLLNSFFLVYPEAMEDALP